MSSGKAHLLLIKGMLSDFPEDDQKKVKECAEQLKAIIKDNGDLGQMAMALVTAEAAAELQQ